MTDQSMFDVSSYHYNLPERLIARYPLKHRNHSRLLVANIDNHEHLPRLLHREFHQLPDFLQAGDLLVFNNTQVLKARLFGQKDTGGRVEVFVLKIHGRHATAFIKASKAPKIGARIQIFSHNQQLTELSLEVLGQNSDGTYEVAYADDWLLLLHEVGHLPLPPYINRQAEMTDEDRYQTVWASEPGAVAAPTASLHFTQEMISELAGRGIDHGFLTLHVGAGTFAPVRTSDIRKHQMHSEYYQVSAKLVQQINSTRSNGGRIVAVGTTVLRTLETVAHAQALDGKDISCSAENIAGETDIFIYPGFEFKLVDTLVTNFHLPESTLLMLVSAFAGKKNIEHIYQAAIAHEYRFFSYGDAMLLSRVPSLYSKNKV